MMKRFIRAAVFLLCVLPSRAHADWSTDAIHVYCDEDKNIFRTQTVTVPEDNFDFVKKEFPEGEIFDKMLGVKLGEGQNYNYLVVKSNDASAVSRKCTVKSRNGESQTFTLNRTKIDTGNVQRMCGAAISAEFEVRVDGTPILTFPSARENCYRQKGSSHNPTLSFGLQGLKICEIPKLQRFKNGEFELEQNGRLCRTGSIDSHFERLSLLSKAEDEPDEISAKMIIERLKIRNVQLRELRAELQTEREATQMQVAKISQIESELKAQEAKLLALKRTHSQTIEDYENLKSETETAAKRSFWQKLRGRGKGE